MTVTIKRNTGWLGKGSRISLKLNGEKVLKIADSQKIELTIQNDRAHLQVTQFGSKSNGIEITNGDTVEITSAKMSYIIYYSILTFVLVMNLSASLTSLTFTVYMTFLIFGLIILIGSFFLVNIYNLKILDNKSRN
ncbi:MAG: hypothetical protein RR541_01660 [Carnobacterium sp.]